MMKLVGPELVFNVASEETPAFVRWVRTFCASFFDRPFPPAPDRHDVKGKIKSLMCYRGFSGIYSPIDVANDMHGIVIKYWDAAYYPRVFCLGPDDGFPNYPAAAATDGSVSVAILYFAPDDLKVIVHIKKGY